MPHVNSSGGDDLTSTDEVKVYKDEGEEENRSSENLLEDKHELVTETEEEKRSDSLIGGYGSGVEKRSGGGQDGKTPEPDRPGLPPGSYPLFPPYTYPNGATVPGSLLNHPYLNGAASRLHNGTAMFFHSLAQSLASPVSPHDKGSKVPMVQPPHPSSLSSIMMYPSSEHLAQPPPAHMGIPPVHIDPKTGLPRPPMYAIPPPPGQFSHHLYSDISQMQWNGHPGYSMATGYRGPYPGLSNSPLARFSPPGMLPPHHSMHPGMQHPAIVTPGPKQELLENHRHPLLHGHDQSSNASDNQTDVTPKKPHIKKPLNAFMLFMKEQRAKVAAECTLKESAAINQILGRRWHALDRSEQAKYYEMARKEKELHLQLYPGWSARDNYASNTKKKKRKREQPGNATNDTKNAFGQGFARSPPTIGYTGAYSGEYLLPNSGSTTTTSNTINNNNNHTSTGFDLTSSPRVSQPLQFGIPETQKECTNPKKCRARFGLDQQSQWCKPCRRKKKCIRFMTGEDGSGSDDDDDIDDPEGGGSVATVDSTTDLEGGSSQGSPAPSASSSLLGVSGVPSQAAIQYHQHQLHLASLGLGKDPSDLQHPAVSQSVPASPPPHPGLHIPTLPRTPGRIATPPATTATATLTGSRHLNGGSGSRSESKGSSGGLVGSSGNQNNNNNVVSHQNHSLSDSNQDSLHSTVRAGAGSSSNSSVDAASSSNKPHVSTVLAT